MSAPTLILPRAAETAHKWIDAAPKWTTVTFHKPRRSLPQNARMWAMLSEIADAAEHNGRKYSPEAWKCLFMHALGHEAKFMVGLSGEPFPVGFRSSRLSKEQMGELMDFIEAWAAESGVYKEQVE